MEVLGMYTTSCRFFTTLCDNLLYSKFTKNENRAFLFQLQVYITCIFTHFWVIPWKRGQEDLKQKSLTDLIFIYVITYASLSSVLTKI